jgi:TPR repeat protein
LWDGRGVSKDRSTAARYFRFAAEQGVSEAQYRCAIALLTGDVGHRNLTAAFCYLKLSTENGFPDGQLALMTVEIVKATSFSGSLSPWDTFSIVLQRGGSLSFGLHDRSTKK